MPTTLWSISTGIRADEYCQWAAGRLPTEAEWEKTARGIDGNIYPWGNQESKGDLLNFADKNFAQKAYWADTGIDDGYPYTSPVGNYPNGASSDGAMDMPGNVIEWVADPYDLLYYSRSPSKTLKGQKKALDTFYAAVLLVLNLRLLVVLLALGFFIGILTLVFAALFRSKGTSLKTPDRS
jgi:hypothetical protein